jgi:hypothetical protein
MADGAISTLSRTKAVSRVARLQSSLRSIRDQAKTAASRAVIVGATLGGAWLGGWISGWAERTGKDVTIGDSQVTYSLAGGIGAALVGALFSRQIGEQAADVLMGLGSGIASAEIAMSGRAAGLKPPSP